MSSTNKQDGKASLRGSHKIEPIHIPRTALLAEALLQKYTSPQIHARGREEGRGRGRERDSAG